MICENPVIRGFYPDPSVCFAQGKYYLATSSFEYFPGVPLFESDDLLHWTPIGHALTRPSQLDIAGIGASGGIYAPTLRFHDGRFYMATTNVSSPDGNFYVWTDDIHSGAWSEPIRVKRGGIDPSLLFDDDGRVYFASNGRADDGSHGISLCEIDIASGGLLSPARRISPGSGGRNVEAPHLYKIDGWYYLLTAEGGTEYGHMECLFRSRDVWGPYEGCPWNPILTSRDDPGNLLQATGHADLVEGPGGQWFLVHLAIRQIPRSARSYHTLGRETCLMPVFWTDDGWFRVGDEGVARERWELRDGVFSVLPAAARRRAVWALDPARASYLRVPDASAYRFGPASCCGIRGSSDRLGSKGTVSWIGMRQYEWDTSMRATLDASTLAEGQRAGVTAYMNENDHYVLAATRHGNHVDVLATLHLGGLSMPGGTLPLPAGPVDLAIECTRDDYRLLAGAAGSPPRPLAQAPSRYLATEVSGGFTGVYLALFSDAPADASPAFARFTW